MCKTDNKMSSQWGVSDKDKIDIVKQHNMLRGNVEPPATDLPAMVSRPFIKHTLINYN